MDYGFNIPNRGPLADPDSIAKIARRAEALGYAILAVPDHIVMPLAIDSRYPYSETGDYPGGPGGDCLEQLNLMAYLAAVTSHARLLSSVMVVPHRPPVMTAKMIATIDVLSGGRVILGCGAGWMREEFEAIGAPPFDKRGRVTDEYIRVFRELWCADQPGFEGEYARFADIAFLPKPVQKPHPPIWTGGESGPALRRAGLLADGWYPIGGNPRYPLDTPARYGKALDTVLEVAEEAGRDPAAITRAFWANWYSERERTDDSGGRRIFTGGPEQVAQDIGWLKDAGVVHVLVSFLAPTLAETLDRMARFAAEVVPRVGD
ncbi:MAG: TIGR03619 family F420-dependent LLM class oxidoreductase [Alphaproteobacteria bacterium]|jgi:probable F420-dependent oxidoreductase|nr:TIGR03619 family F420-dependent LLM class oxidoreductase [Alphaproteobacteria bacterium]MDP6517714.1 TIGR03619 family F420-dependent LLM class oxidoreductase [Alphaproteobacteria bacterium]